MGMKVGVVVPVLNQFRLAVDALASVQTWHPWTPYIIRNYRQNIGVAGAWNEGTKRAINDGCSHILIINDDILLAKTTINHLVYVMKNNNNIGLLSASDYSNRYTAEAFEETFESPVPPEHDIIDAPHFSCFMITKRSYGIVGEFDENFSPAYFEDNDYCHRVLLSGLSIVRSQNAGFYHYKSKTQNEGRGVVQPHQFNNNRNYFVRKWGGLPGAEKYTTPFNDPTKTWSDV